MYHTSAAPVTHACAVPISACNAAPGEREAAHSPPLPHSPLTGSGPQVQCQLLLQAALANDQPVTDAASAKSRPRRS